MNEKNENSDEILTECVGRMRPDGVPAKAQAGNQVVFDSVETNTGTGRRP